MRCTDTTAARKVVITVLPVQVLIRHREYTRHDEERGESQALQNQKMRTISECTAQHAFVLSQYIIGCGAVRRTRPNNPDLA